MIHDQIRDFVAIDFETANESRESACSLGIAVVTNGVVTSRHYLIRPREMRFTSINVSIHGIRPEHVRNSPEWPDLLPQVRDVLSNYPVWAHWSAFEQGVLNALSARYRLPEPPRLCCSCKLARKVWPRFENHKLNHLCEKFGIPLVHHSAESDARASAMVVKKAASDDYGRQIVEQMMKTNTPRRR